jgi:hypothetical protein
VLVLLPALIALVAAACESKTAELDDIANVKSLSDVVIALDTPKGAKIVLAYDDPVDAKENSFKFSVKATGDAPTIELKDGDAPGE